MGAKTQRRKIGAQRHAGRQAAARGAADPCTSPITITEWGVALNETGARRVLCLEGFKRAELANILRKREDLRKEVDVFERRDNGPLRAPQTALMQDPGIVSKSPPSGGRHSKPGLTRRSPRFLGSFDDYRPAVRAAGCCSRRPCI